jgi:hypothetical protein
VNNNQKGTDVQGLSEEVLDSSADILKGGQHGGLKGLQQFYTPPELSDLIKAALGSSDGQQIQLPTFDPTAGDGSLLKAVAPARAYGVEIDKDQIKNAESSYQAICADIKDVATLLYRVMPQFPLILANPPFGLEDWSDPAIEDGKKLGSTLLTWKYVEQMLTDDGQFVFITGKNRFYREIEGTSFAKGIYFVIECADLFEGTNEPCVIAWGVHPDVREDAIYNPHAADSTSRYENTEGYVTKVASRSELKNLAGQIRSQRKAAQGDNRIYSNTWGGMAQFLEAWEAVQAEHKIRVRMAKGQKIANDAFDLWADGDKIRVKPSAFAQIVLAQEHKLRPLLKLANKKLNWFASYEQDWEDVKEALDVGVLRIDPYLVDRVERILQEKHKNELPLYKIPLTQRIGFLKRHKEIKCLKSDEERHFTAGESYRIDIDDQSVEKPAQETKIVQRGENAGELKIVDYLYTARYLDIQIKNDNGRTVHFYDSVDHQEDIKYIVEHFELPDPGDVRSLYPDEVDHNREILWALQKKIKACAEAWDAKHTDRQKKPFHKLRHFQVEDLSRMLVKKTGVLAWHQGLGKTIGAIAWFTAQVRLGRSKDRLLIICPQDLIEQWRDEVERFTGRKLQLIRTHGDAVNVKRLFKKGGRGWYITYYEALATNGVRGKTKLKAEVPVETKVEKVRTPGTGRRGDAQMAKWDEMGEFWQGISRAQYIEIPYHQRNEQGFRWIPRNSKHFPNVKPPTDGEPTYCGWGYINPVYTTKETILTSKHLCPQCKAEKGKGWNGMACKAEDRDGNICNYVHWEHRVKPMGSLLSVTFKDSAIVVDEGTMISGDTSKRSEVIRGLNSRCKLLMTGTPIKEYIPHAFWPLWWALGNNSPRFPFGYKDKTDFENKHAVIRYTIVANKRAARKVMPKVTGLSELWAMLPASIIRRRKEETGEPLVPHRKHLISVPLGVAQVDAMDQWIKRFPDWFIETHPDSDVVTKGGRAVVEQMTPMLGLAQKLEWAEICPAGDKDIEWTGVEGTSNWTPANLRTILVTMTLVKQGRKVIVGSSLIKEAEFLAAALKEKGVNVVSFVDETGSTIDPKKRAKMVQTFQSDKGADVIVTTQKSLRFGHNVDAATAMVVCGLPWEFEVWDQFINRHHRFTSFMPVDTYCIVPGGEAPLEGQDQPTVTRRKWNLLEQKGDAAALALDGRLIEHDIEDINQEMIARQMMESGFTIQGNEIPEEEVEAHWNDVPHIDQYEADERLLKGRDDEEEETGPSAWEIFVSVVGDFTQEQWALPVKTGPERDWTPVPTPLSFEVTEVEHGEEQYWVAPPPVVLIPPEDTFSAPVEVEYNPTIIEDETDDQVADATKFSDPPLVGNNGHVQSKADLVEAIKGLKELLDIEAIDVLEYGEAKKELLAQLKEAI